MRISSIFLLLLLSLTLFPPDGSAQSNAALGAILRNGGALIIDAQGRELLSYRPDDHFIPASVLKLATASAALDTLGPEFRFITECYQGEKGELYLKGYGDPKLVSEELRDIASELRVKLSAVTSIVLDDSYFASDVQIDGASSSTNPYDATNGALLANFNTVFLERIGGGGVKSAEPQTPLTPIARSVAPRLSLARERINLGPDKTRALRYVGELMQAFLKEQGIRVSGGIEYRKVPPTARLMLKHRASEALSTVVAGLLEYSTNFSANQLFLVLGAERFGAPATADKAARALTEYLRNKFGWATFTVVEGAGLSRKNRLTPRQMTELVTSFAHHKALLPSHHGGRYRAKTGSLRGVSTFAGFAALESGDAAFAVLVNDNVGHDYKFSATNRLFELIGRPQ